ncbi:hypothetical protein ACK8HY_06410 [Sphingobacterium sp. NGMCC 1.201703]|uniref:hypothetical protein n=1 Tax=unclassified Sphingobacterium TaxID=2609468 RepID=UPI00158E66C5|nr:hypothetical protein [Sphingobacterium sp. CZ-UAM]
MADLSVPSTRYSDQFEVRVSPAVKVVKPADFCNFIDLNSIGIKQKGHGFQ